MASKNIFFFYEKLAKFVRLHACVYNKSSGDFRDPQQTVTGSLMAAIMKQRIAPLTLGRGYGSSSKFSTPKPVEKKKPDNHIVNNETVVSDSTQKEDLLPPLTYKLDFTSWIGSRSSDWLLNILVGAMHDDRLIKICSWRQEVSMGYNIRRQEIHRLKRKGRNPQDSIQTGN
ncbi:hypothetical protein P5673_019803 [Acropora cervicornis]|uniref:Uncharacterized protein n=1 Tax=Acropora cervicornis TaxID=6130 RepID=A0AAD9QAJ6_ACRCE|nr:hypothetical protein P5673_019803 [Acropora cervicornis]